MSLIKWEPFDEFDSIFRDGGLLPVSRAGGFGSDMAVDIYEDGNNIIAEMNVPGLEAKDIDVEIQNNNLHIAGRREEHKEKKEKEHFTKEIRRGSFERLVHLPSPVEKENVTARYAEGILKITMPKQTGSERSKVKIEAGPEKK